MIPLLYSSYVIFFICSHLIRTNNLSVFQPCECFCFLGYSFIGEHHYKILYGGKQVDRNPIIRKCVTVGIIFLFLGVCITPAIAQIGERPSLPTRRSAQKTDIGLSGVVAGGFALESVISLSWNANETEEPLEPGGAPRSINITVTYQVLASSFLGRLILLYCLVTHQYATVTVKTGDVPSWCTASLSDSELQFPITGDVSSQFITLTVAANEYAPHYDL